MRKSTLLFAVLAVTTIAMPARAQVFDWNNSAGGNWNLAGNWSPGLPTFGAGVNETLNFGGFFNDITPGYIATYNNPGGQFTRAINFNNTFGAPLISLAASTTLTLNAAGGFNPEINQNGFGLGQIGAFTLAAGSPLTIGGSGVGNLTLNGLITNTNNNVVTINQTGGGFLGTGASMIFTTANNFGTTGNTVLSAGNLVINNATAFGSNAANTITINGGTVRIGHAGAAVTMPNNWILNSNLNISHANGFVANVLTGAISGNGGIVVENTQNFQVALQGTNTFSGAVVSRSSFAYATNFILSSNVGQTLNGSMLNVTSANLGPISSLIVDNSNATGTAVTRLSTGLNLTLNRANFTMQGNGTLAGNESINSLTSVGMSGLALNPGNNSPTGAGSNLTIGTWVRNNLATATITAANLGNAPGANVGSLTITNDPGGALGGILPYAIANNSATATATNTFVRWNGANGRIEALNLATDYQTGGLPTYLNTNSTAQYRQGFIQNGLNGTTTVNSLILETNGAAAQFIGNAVAGAGTLRISSGAFMSTLVGGATAGTVAPTVAVGTLDFGANPGYIHTPTSVLITSNITGSGGLVRSGGGALFLFGDNAFTGHLYSQFGNIVFDRDVNLGAASNEVRLNAAQTGMFLLPYPLYTTGATNSVTTARNFVIGEGGGGITVANATGTYTITGNLSGTGNLGKVGGGTLIIDPTSGSNAGYTGRLSIQGGILAVRNDAAIGAPGTPVEFVGTAATGGLPIFQPLSSFTTTRNFLTNATGSTAGTGAQFFTNGFNLQIDGIIGTQNNATAQNIFKLGTGDLILTGANTYNGATTIGGTGAVIPSAPAFAQTGGRIVLQGANGSAALSTGWTLNPGSTLVMDNGAAANNFRVGMVPFTTNGAEIALLGNSSANVTQAIGAFTANSLGTTITLDQPATGGGTGVTTLVMTSYAASAVNTATVFFRGNNLGGVTGDRTAVLFNTTPPLTAGILPSAVGSTSATGGPTDFVTVVGGALQIFTGYVPNTPNAGPLSVTDITNANVLGGASSTGAARISTGGSVNLSGNSWTITTGHILSTAAGGATISNSGVLANLALGTNGRITNTTDLTIGANVGITASAVTKFGQGNLIINQAASSSAWNIAQGTVTYGVANALPATAAVTLAPGATLDLNNNAVTAANISGFGTVNIGTGSLTLSSNSTTFMGSLQGSGNITLGGANTFTVTGNSAGYTGNWSLNAGTTLAVGSNNALGSGTITLNAATAQATITAGGGFGATTISNNIIANTTTSTSGPQITAVAGTSIEFTGTITINNTNATVGFRLNGPFSSTAVQSGAWTISGNITSAGNAGPVSWFGGNWNLHGNNTINGFQMDAGNALVLGVGQDSALGGASSTVTVTTFGGMLRADNGPRTLANPFILNGAANNFTITGTNALTLNGTLLLNSTGTTNHNINVINTATTTIAGVISANSATAPMSKTGFGDLVLSGANTFAGGFNLVSGSLGFGSSSGGGNGPVGTGTLTIGNGANIRAAGAARTVSNPVTVNGDFVVDGTQVLTLSGAMNLGNLVRTVAVSNSATTFFSGAIAGAGGGSITKEGAGTLVVNNATGCTYTGGTTINNGRLLINNASGSALGGGAVVVNNGGRLGVLSTAEGGTGIGSFSGGLFVNSGGFVKAGNSVGLLTVGGGITLNAGSTAEFEINGITTAGVDFSQIISSGLVTINNATLILNPSILVPLSATITLVRNDSGAAVAGIFAGLPEGALISAGPNLFQLTYLFNDPSGDGQGNDIAITAVPEPASIALMLGGALGAGGFWWRRRQKRLEAELLPSAG